MTNSRSEARALLADLRRIPMTEWVWADAERIFATLESLTAFTEPAAAVPGVPEREAIARIIAPGSWALRERHLEYAEQAEYADHRVQWVDRANEDVAGSLAKADAILALIPSHSGETGEVERLREALENIAARVPKRVFDGLGHPYRCQVCAWRGHVDGQERHSPDCAYVLAKATLATPNDGGRDDASND